MEVITHVVLALPLSQDMAVYEMLAVPVAEAVGEDVDVGTLLAVEEEEAVEDDVAVAESVGGI